jgi:hypothetical protein
MSIKINVRTIPHADQHYETCGDYFVDKQGRIKVTVSDVGNNDYEYLVALHEIVELWLCKKRGISFDDITNFDKEHLDSDDPGSLPDAPYFKEHYAATIVEKFVCKELGIDWEEYDKRLMELYNAKKEDLFKE